MGKVPKRTGGRIQIKRQIDELKKELQIRIVQEEFETVAEIRDQIRELERNMAQG